MSSSGKYSTASKQRVLWTSSKSKDYNISIEALACRSCSGILPLLMFGSFAQYKNLLDTNHGRLLFPSESMRFCLAALMAGSTEAILTSLERIQMLLQDRQSHRQYNNTIDAFRKLKIYGIKEYYRGLTAILCRNSPSNVLCFTFRGKANKFLPEIDSKIWW